MTEIPEHLLKRSKERRAAMGLPGGESGESGGAATAAEASPAAPPVAAAAAAAPAKAAAPPPPPPPKPLPAHVQAAIRRKRIPYWAMPIVALLPVWAWIYADSVTPPEAHDSVLTLGSETYRSCAGCHGGRGEGGTGPQLADGEVLLTFPDPVAMMQWIYLGGDAWTGTSGPADYGDPDRPGGPHNTGDFSSPMPPHSGLSAEELAAVTRFAREQLSGEVVDEATADLYLQWAEQAITGADAGDLVYNGVDPDPERITAVGAGG